MSYLVGLKKMVVLDYNAVVQFSHTWTTSFTTVAGNGPEMLSDDDATSLCKSSGSLTTPWIQIEIPGGTSISAWGVCNHNFKTAGISGIVIEWWDVSVWKNVDDPGSTTYALGHATNLDFALLFDAVTSTKFRMRFVQTPTENIYVGYIFVGTGYPLNGNPSSFIQRRKLSTRYIESAGGTSHALLGPAYQQGELEMSWTRATGFDLRKLNGFDLPRNDYIYGIIPPEATPNPLLAPGSQPVFFGRMSEIEMEPLTPSNITVGNERYNIFVSMKGCV